MRFTVRRKIVGLVLTVLALMLVAMVAVASISVSDMRDSMRQDSKDSATAMALQLARTLDAGVNDAALLSNPAYMQKVVDQNLAVRAKDDTQITEFRVHAPDSSSSNGYRAIACNTPDCKGQESDPEDIDAIHKDQVVILTEDEDGVPVLDVTVPLHAGGKAIATAGIKVSLAATQAKNDTLVSDTTNRMILAATLVGLVALLLALALGYFVARNISRPIVQLRNVVEKVSLGDLDVKVGVSRSDEIGDLAAAVDRLTVAMRVFAGGDQTPEKGE